MANNKVVYNGDTLIDLTEDTATAADVAQGKTFHLASGAQATGTALTGLTILSYGHSTWNDFITAYNNNSVVYCRASSGSNPASGSQTRLAFMAYVNNATSPTEVEFQYYRSVNAHSDSQQGDQVYVYKLTSSGTWTVTVRNTFTKIAAGSGLTGSWVSGVLTLSAPDIATLNTEVADHEDRIDALEQSSSTLILSMTSTAPSSPNDPQVATVSGYTTFTDVLDAMPNVVVRWELPNTYEYRLFHPTDYIYDNNDNYAYFECSIDDRTYTLYYLASDNKWTLDWKDPTANLPYEDWIFEVNGDDIVKRVFCIDVTP